MNYLIRTLVFPSLLISALLAVFAFEKAEAQIERPYRVGPISSALGGSGRATADATEAAWLNPAALVHIKGYHFGFSHQQSSRSGTGPGNAGSSRDFGVMLADSGEERLAAGALSYIRRNTTRGVGGLTGEQQDIQVSLASFVYEKLSLGATYRRLMHVQSGADVNQDNFTVGLMYPWSKGLGFALVGQDLAGASDSVAPEARMSPSLGFGIHAIPHEILHLRGDIVRPLKNNPQARQNVHLGLESWFNPQFAFRVGSALLEERDETWYTAGIGFKGPRLSFSYAFEKESRGNEATRHTFDLWMPF